MTSTFRLTLSLIICFAFTVNVWAAPLRVEHFVRIQGQDETEIRAFGIVSGLNGTGDDVKSYSPFAQAIMRQLARSGMPVPGSDTKGISSVRNSALVEVTARIPGTGARNGDLIDCTIVSIGGAKSLASGVLSTTMLATPLQQDENTAPLGMASGKITIPQQASPNVGQIANGCRLLADFLNPYIQSGLMTLNIRKEYAHPNMANKIAEAINMSAEFEGLSVAPAKAINSRSVVVRVPTTDFLDPMDFVAKVLNIEVLNPPTPVPRITIDERAGIIVIDENVEVKPTAITYLNYVADMAPELAAGEQEQFPRQFIDIDTDTKFRQMSGEDVTNLKLKALQASLNALRATPQDIIAIIKVLQAQGAIIGDVVFID
jgi:flagellar P-ring protein precursor FlgI